MKIIVLLLALVFGFGATVKNSADDMKKLQERSELNEYNDQPNMLPEVEIVAEKL